MPNRRIEELVDIEKYDLPLPLEIFKRFEGVLEYEPENISFNKIFAMLHDSGIINNLGIGRRRGELLTWELLLSCREKYDKAGRRNSKHIIDLLTSKRFNLSSDDSTLQEFLRSWSMLFDVHSFKYEIRRDIEAWRELGHGECDSGSCFGANRRYAWSPIALYMRPNTFVINAYFDDSKLARWWGMYDLYTSDIFVTNAYLYNLNVKSTDLLTSIINDCTSVHHDYIVENYEVGKTGVFENGDGVVFTTSDYVKEFYENFCGRGCELCGDKHSDFSICVECEELVYEAEIYKCIHCHKLRPDYRVAHFQIHGSPNTSAICEQCEGDCCRRCIDCDWYAHDSYFIDNRCYSCQQRLIERADTSPAQSSNVRERLYCPVPIENDMYASYHFMKDLITRSLYGGNVYGE